MCKWRGSGFEQLSSAVWISASASHRQSAAAWTLCGERTCHAAAQPLITLRWWVFWAPCSRSCIKDTEVCVCAQLRKDDWRRQVWCDWSMTRRRSLLSLPLRSAATLCLKLNRKSWVFLTADMQCITVKEEMQKGKKWCGKNTSCDQQIRGGNVSHFEGDNGTNDYEYINIKLGHH